MWSFFERRGADVNEQVLAEIQSLSKKVAELRGEKDALHDVTAKQREVNRLTAQLEQIKIEKERIEDQQEREEMKVRHEVGLLRLQVEAERDIAVQRATLEVEQTTLDRNRELFEKEMKFTRERFSEEVGYLREIAKQMMDRLPVVNVNKEISDRPAATGDTDAA